MTPLETAALALGYILAPTGAAGATLSLSRRSSLVSLVGVFAGAALIVGVAEAPRVGLSLAVSGGACVAILATGFARSGWSFPGARTISLPGGRGFRLAAILLFGTAAWGLSSPFLEAIPQESPTRVTCALVVMGIGLLHLGLSQEQGSSGVGLLTTLVGFEILYAGLEPALAVRAVLAAIMVGIALVSAILLAEGVEMSVEDRRSR